MRLVKGRGETVQILVPSVPFRSKWRERQLIQLVEGKPEVQELIEQAREEMAIGTQIYQFRTEAELSQGALAEKVGTTASALSRLENAAYEGHSVAMRRKIASVLGMRVHITFIDSDSDKDKAA